MTHLWAEGQSITVLLDEHSRPLHFTWLGRQYTCQQIVQQWQVDLEWWREPGRIWRDYLALITVDGLFCVLYHDRLVDEWRLVRVYD
jgi:hypothetical protein